MNYGTTLDPIPLWLLFLMTIAAICLAVEGGYRLGNYRRGH